MQYERKLPPELISYDIISFVIRSFLVEFSNYQCGPFKFRSAIYFFHPVFCEQITYNMSQLSCTLMLLHTFALLCVASVFMNTTTFLPEIVRRGGGKSGKSTRRSGGNSRNFTSSCFPASAIVNRKNGDIEISNLRVGDLVLTKQGWSRVYMFSHADEHAHNTNFVRINAPPRSLMLTSDHYVLINHGEIMADQVETGHYLYDSYGDPLLVTSVQKNLCARGLYNPHTISGTIVVDGVIASTYTRVVSMHTANALLAPLRAIFISFKRDYSHGILERNSALLSSLILIADKLRLFD